HAQYLNFQTQLRPTPPPREPEVGDPPMLVQANEIQYDYPNERVVAVGSVQIYYRGSTVQADKIIYDQRTKHLHAEGNVRLTGADGVITYGDLLDLSDDLRNGFIDSLRLETADQTRFAAARGRRSEGNFTVLESGVYTACQPCRDDPRRPPLVAGQGGPDHPQPVGENDLFRGRAHRVLRRAPRLHALYGRARSHREAEVGLPDAAGHHQFHLRRRGRNTLLLRARAEL
ncbi:MAG: LPS-assembly protein LptD, partial [Candidatus Competibacteraceae bacterium]|nr:LPS-assembly protein LptD [Candidatus Competibacteraceae bacterium]